MLLALPRKRYCVSYWFYVEQTRDAEKKCSESIVRTVMRGSSTITIHFPQKNTIRVKNKKKEKSRKEIYKEKGLGDQIESHTKARRKQIQALTSTSDQAPGSTFAFILPLITTCVFSVYTIIAGFIIRCSRFRTNRRRRHSFSISMISLK